MLASPCDTASLLDRQVVTSPASGRGRRRVRWPRLARQRGPASVAHYLANGASQLARAFELRDASGHEWTFRITRAPACWGTLNVLIDPAGGTLFEADPGD